MLFISMVESHLNNTNRGLVMGNQMMKLTSMFLEHILPHQDGDWTFYVQFVLLIDDGSIQKKGDLYVITFRFPIPVYSLVFSCVFGRFFDFGGL